MKISIRSPLRLLITVLAAQLLCLSSAAAQEVCGNNLDDDGDGQFDCNDSDCAGVPDEDGDGSCDSTDQFLGNAFQCGDSSADGDTCDDCGAPNFTFDPSADGFDTDGDGLCNNGDDNDDNDAFTDAEELACLTDTLTVTLVLPDNDFDVDGLPAPITCPMPNASSCGCDELDDDDDNDGVLDVDELFCGSDPIRAPQDTDGDFLPNLGPPVAPCQPGGFLPCLPADIDNDSICEPAVDNLGRAGDPLGIIGGEEQRHVGDVVRFAHPMHGLGLSHHVPRLLQS